MLVDAPTNTVIDRTAIEVEEGSTGGHLDCSSSAYPLANYYWQYNHQIIGNGPRLTLDYGLSRDKTGEYSCVAHNQHGNSSAKAFINVVCKYLIILLSLLCIPFLKKGIVPSEVSLAVEKKSAFYL